MKKKLPKKRPQTLYQRWTFERACTMKGRLKHIDGLLEYIFKHSSGTPLWTQAELSLLNEAQQCIQDVLSKYKGGTQQLKSLHWRDKL